MQEYETRMKAEGGLSVLPTNLSDLIPAMTGSMVARMRSQRLTETEVDLNHINNTAQLRIWDPISITSSFQRWGTSSITQLFQLWDPNHNSIPAQLSQLWGGINFSQHWDISTAKLS